MNRDRLLLIFIYKLKHEKKLSFKNPRVWHYQLSRYHTEWYTVKGKLGLE